MLMGWKWVWVLMAMTNATALLINFGMIGSMTAVLDVAQVQEETGYAYRSPLHDVDGQILETQFGAWDRRTRQGVALLENGREMGFHASSLRQIREVGHGASLQWGPTFFFSTSDNSDPKNNGRTYAIVFPLVIKRWVVGVLAAMTLLLGGMWGWSLKSEGWSRLWQSGIVAVEWMHTSRTASHLANTTTVCVIATAGFMVYRIILDATGSLPMLSPDSFSYLGWFQSRTPGYPLFLQGIFSFTDDARWIVPVQLNVLLLSVALMGWALGRLFHSRLFALLITLLIFTATPILMLSWQVLTELLYTACLCLHLACVATFLRTGSRTAALLIGCTAGAAIAVRPSGYALVACYPILLWFKADGWRSALTHMTIGLAITLGLTIGAQYAQHDLLSTQSFGGFSLAGHVAPLITEECSTIYPEIAGRIARRIAPLATQIPDPFLQPTEHTRLYLQFVNPMLYGIIMPEILGNMREQYPYASDAVRWQQGDSLAMSLALSAIISRPSWYAMHGFANYWDLWGQLETQLLRLEEYLSESRRRTEELILEQPGGLRHFDVNWYAESWPARRYRPVDPPIRFLDQIWASMPFWRPHVVRPVFLCSFLALLGLLWAKNLSPRAQAVIYTGAALQSCLGFLGFVNPGVFRFVVPLMPFLIVFSVGGSVVLCQWGWEKMLEVYLDSSCRRRSAQTHGAPSSSCLQ